MLSFPFQICKKRGPLGACLETERRTEENDNDKAKKYFRDPSELIKAKEAAMRRNDEDEGNALIQKLRLQSEQNREKNDLAVQRKTFENDQVSRPKNTQVFFVGESFGIYHPVLPSFMIGIQNKH